MDRRKLAGKLAAAAICVSAAAATTTGWNIPAFAGEEAAIGEEAVVIEYGNLSQLVMNNQDLQSETENYNTTIENYQSLLKSLEEERDYMKFLAEKYEDDADAEGSYKSNAAILNNSISQINRRLSAQYRKSGTISVEKIVDSYTITAQTLMNTYNQMALNVDVKEKAVEAAKAAYEAAVNSQASGMATASEVLEASDSLARERNLLEAYRQQETQARFDLLSTLGIEDSGQVTVGKIPEPDLEAIGAIDFESDRETAVNNNKTVQNARHANAGTYTEQARKAGTEAEAEGNARASIQAAWQEIQSSMLSYEAALDSFESASMIYQSLLRRNQEGMLTRAEFLEGEAAYLQAGADKETASMNLYQAWETYRWEVKGVS
ncbi:TolC family protein [Clostridium sp. AN503]|uniref:TolC family protein n=1 Tax=Clostridium sp. AN503 TaxID=3160598 RepID=UPI00345B3E42